MKTKLLSIMCITMLFMGCDLFGPSCEDLQAELITATDAFAVSSASAFTSGDYTTAVDDCDAVVAKMQEYVDAGCGDEEGGYAYTADDITAVTASCTLMEAFLTE